jgi:hypothetical protein
MQWLAWTPVECRLPIGPMDEVTIAEWPDLGGTPASTCGLQTDKSTVAQLQDLLACLDPPRKRDSDSLPPRIRSSGIGSRRMPRQQHPLV